MTLRLAPYLVRMLGQTHFHQSFAVLVLIACTPLVTWTQGGSAVQGWGDEFNGTSVDLTNWGFDLGTGAAQGLVGWGNNELQTYTNDPGNVFVSDGMLHIVAKPGPAGGPAFTSARLKSRNLRYGRYGRVEARIDLPTGQGIWPAFWMLREIGVWPGEIDIMEIIGSQPGTLHGTCHQGELPNLFSLGGSIAAQDGDWTDGFHVFGVNWWPDFIQWTVDDVVYFEVSRQQVNPNFEWLFDEDYHLLLNVAVGGNWPGSPNSTTSFPQTMRVDWVRWHPLPTAEQPVQFRVDVSAEEVGPGDIVYLNGSFNGWCGNCEPMVHAGNGLWLRTRSLPPGLHEFKFTTNGWNGLIENFSPDIPCGIATYGAGVTYVNRFVQVTDEPVTTPAYCFGSCGVCPGSEAPEQEWDVRLQCATPAVGPVSVVVDGVSHAMEPGLLGHFRAEFWAQEGATYYFQQGGISELTPLRSMPVNPTSTVLGPFCWESYEPCPLPDLTQGCIYPLAQGYFPGALWDNGTCIWGGEAEGCGADLDGNGAITVADLLILLGQFGLPCN
jgi:beta-glucanase (GH16 family)